MKQKMKVLITVLAILILATGFSGCSLLAELLTSVNGYVYVQGTTTGLEGVTVTLYNSNGTEITTDVTSSTGFYSFSSNGEGFENGYYTITAVLDGYTINPLTGIYLGGSGDTLPAMFGDDGVATVITTTAASGTVLNAMAASTVTEYWKDGTDSLEGATINFYKIGSDRVPELTAAATATVGANGTYSVSELDMGDYKVVGEKTGWVFVPRLIEVSGENMTMPPAIAYPAQAADTVVIVLSWENDNLDLDGFLTYYDGTDRDYIGYLSSTTVSNNNLDLGTITPAGTKAGSSTNEFCPITRPRDITASNSTNGTPAGIPRVETILIPWSDSAKYLDAAGSHNDVADNELLYYVNCYTSDLSLTGLDTTGTVNDVPYSNAQVDVMYTDYANITAHYGSAKVPWNTDSKVMQMVSISVDSTDGFVITVESDNVYNYNSDKNIIRSAE